MNAKEVVAELKRLGKESYKKVMLKHGAREPFFGTSIEDMKKIQKRIEGGKDYQLALDLYATGISDAMYMAGLIADETRMTKKDLETWAKGAVMPMIAEYTVPWVASETPHGRELALKWIDSKNESLAAMGWSTLSSFVGITEDTDLDLVELKSLLKRVEQTIHQAPNRVRYVMNSFVIAVGCAVAPLTPTALATAAKIGKVSVDMGGTACKVPLATEYIAKVKKMGRLGKKRKSARC